MGGLLAIVALLLATGCGSGHWGAGAPYAGAPASSSAPWSAPPVALTAPPLKSNVEIDPERIYDTTDLTDLALRNNPETRQAWESARAAAARLGIAESAYLPVLVAEALGGVSRDAKMTAIGTEIIRAAEIDPGLRLSWVLVDFGRRDAERERAEQQLVRQNLTFNRRLQEVVFSVQRAVFAYDASRAQVAAHQATLETARSMEEEATARAERGLATRPEVLLARQERVRAEYELVATRGAVDDAQATLAEGLGLSPAIPVQVIDLSSAPLPAALDESVDETMDRALADRPDLAARLAELRARDAEVRRARAAFLPTVSLKGLAAGAFRTWRGGPPFRSFNHEEPLLGAFLEFQWTLFDGSARESAVLEAQAEQGAASAAMSSQQLRILREVWKAYADVKTASAQLEFAEALLATAENTYSSVLESYRAGLSTFVELLAAERDLAQARTVRISSRAAVLTASAALAFAAGR